MCEIVQIVRCKLFAFAYIISGVVRLVRSLCRGVIVYPLFVDGLIFTPTPQGFAYKGATIRDIVCLFITIQSATIIHPVYCAGIVHPCHSRTQPLFAYDCTNGTNPTDSLACYCSRVHVVLSLTAAKSITVRALSTLTTIQCYLRLLSFGTHSISLQSTTFATRHPVPPVYRVPPVAYVTKTHPHAFCGLFKYRFCHVYSGGVRCKYTSHHLKEHPVWVGWLFVDTQLHRFARHCASIEHRALRPST